MFALHIAAVVVRVTLHLSIERYCSHIVSHRAFYVHCSLFSVHPTKRRLLSFFAHQLVIFFFAELFRHLWMIQLYLRSMQRKWWNHWNAECHKKTTKSILKSRPMHECICDDESLNENYPDRRLDFEFQEFFFQLTEIIIESLFLESLFSSFR